MNYIRHIGVLVLALMSTVLYAQTVSGTVTDENNQPLPGATVVVQGYNRGFEGWTVYRLFDAPTLQNSGTLNLPVPKRYTYPQSEQTINGDNVKAANGGLDKQQTPVFWDKN